MPQLKQLIRGVGVVRGKEGRTARKKRPITPPILLQIYGSRGDNQLNGRDWEMYWAASCTAFFGFMRAGELTVPTSQPFDASNHLSVADVSANHPSCLLVIHIKIKASKTDPFRRGVTVVLGASGKVLCPVKVLVEYLKIRGMEPGPLFRLHSGAPLSKKVFVNWVQSALKKLGFDEKEYSGHSFRVGAATTAAARGIQDSIIKAMGRWESSVYLLYIRIPSQDLQQVALRLSWLNVTGWAGYWLVIMFE